MPEEKRADSNFGKPRNPWQFLGTRSSIGPSVTDSFPMHLLPDKFPMVYAYPCCKLQYSPLSEDRIEGHQSDTLGS